MNNLRPTGLQFVLLQVVLFGAAGIFAAGIYLQLTVLIVAGIVLSVAVGVFFAITTLQRVGTLLPIALPRADPYWPGVLIASAALIAVTYIGLGFAGAVPLTDQTLGGIFVLGGLVYIRLSNFFYHSDLLGREMFPSWSDRFRLKPHRATHVVAGIAMSVMGLLMLVGRF